MSRFNQLYRKIVGQGIVKEYVTKDGRHVHREYAIPYLFGRSMMKKMISEQRRMQAGQILAVPAADFPKYVDKDAPGYDEFSARCATLNINMLLVFFNLGQADNYEHQQTWEQYEKQNDDFMANFTKSLEDNQIHASRQMMGWTTQKFSGMRDYLLNRKFPEKYGQMLKANQKTEVPKDFLPFLGYAQKCEHADIYYKTQQNAGQTNTFLFINRKFGISEATANSVQQIIAHQFFHLKQFNFKQFSERNIFSRPFGTKIAFTQQGVQNLLHTRVDADKCNIFKYVPAQKFNFEKLVETNQYELRYFMDQYQFPNFVFGVFYNTLSRIYNVYICKQHKIIFRHMDGRLQTIPRIEYQFTRLVFAIVQFIQGELKDDVLSQTFINRCGKDIQAARQKFAQIMWFVINQLQKFDKRALQILYILKQMHDNPLNSYTYNMCQHICNRLKHGLQPVKGYSSMGGQRLDDYIARKHMPPYR